MDDKLFKTEYDKAIRKLEDFIIKRQYKKTPYEIELPNRVRRELKIVKIKPVLEILNIKKIKSYFNKNKIPINNLSIYLEYRYLLFYYYKNVKELYDNSKKCPYFYLRNFKFNPDKKIYTSYKIYPNDFELVINTVNNIPNFEHDMLFNQFNFNEEIINLNDNGIKLEFKYEKYKFLDNGYLIVGDNKEKFLKYLNVSKLITERKDGICYNLYDYIYHSKIMAFLENNKIYFHNCDLKLIKEFYKNTGLKLKYVVEDKYRLFNFDIYGIHGTDIFGTDYFNEGVYANYEYDKWDEMQDDYDLRIWFKVAHIDYDDNENIYYQNIYNKWEPYYEDGLDEEEKLDFTGEESENIYLYKKGVSDE